MMSGELSMIARNRASLAFNALVASISAVTSSKTPRKYDSDPVSSRTAVACTRP